MGSYDPRYYDQIITKVNLQQREQQHERDQIAIGRKRVLLVDDEPDICMVYHIVLEDAAPVLW